jgi:tetratricopeptide (TPR) repeat protein
VEQHGAASSATTVQTRIGQFGPWACLAGLLLLTFIAYLPALQGDFVWDDDYYVSDNPLLHDLDGLRRIWTTTETPQYYPLVFTSFWIERHLWGLNSTGYHVTNVLLHALNAFLIGIALSRLGLRGAWWVAVVFALHPVHVESVAWITERKNVLSALFYLLALLAYMRFDQRRARRFYGIALVLFICALLSKTVTSTLPVVILLVLWYRHRKLTARDLINVVPFFAAALAMGLLTVTVEEGMVDAVRAEFAFTPLQRLLISSTALLFYAWKLIVPYPLIFNYPRWELDVSGWLSLWPLLVNLLLVAALAVAWRRGRRGVLCAAAFYVVTLFPALGLFNVYPFRYSFVADHFQYLASIGILVLLISAVDGMIGRAVRAPGVSARAAKTIGWTFGLAVTALLGWLTWHQAAAYRNVEALWLDTIAKNPTSWIAHNNLATLQLERGELDHALVSFEQAIASNPSSAESHTGRATVYARMERHDLALRDLDRAVELDPSYPQAYIRRGEILLELQRYERAVADLTRVLEANPEFLDAYRSRGLAYLGQERFDLAIADFTEALRRGANYGALVDRGAAHARAGNHELALADFDRALALSPDSVEIQHNRGVSLAQLGRHDEALEVFDRVLQADPGARATWLYRGNLFWAVFSDRDRACSDWRQACRLGECRYFEAHCSAQR